MNLHTSFKTLANNIKAMVIECKPNNFSVAHWFAVIPCNSPHAERLKAIVIHAHSLVCCEARSQTA